MLTTSWKRSAARKAVPHSPLCRAAVHTMKNLTLPAPRAPRGRRVPGRATSTGKNLPRAVRLIRAAGSRSSPPRIAGRRARLWNTGTAPAARRGRRAIQAARRCGGRKALTSGRCPGSNLTMSRRMGGRRPERANGFRSMWANRRSHAHGRALAIGLWAGRRSRRVKNGSRLLTLILPKNRGG